MIYVVYKFVINKFIFFVDDVIVRWMMCVIMVDYEFVVGGDKFGNMFFVWCLFKVSEEVDEEFVGLYLINVWDYFYGIFYWFNFMCYYYI